MITVITSSGKDLDSKFDLRFGRAANYCVYNEANNTTDFIENGNKNDQGGAGTKAAERMVELGVGKVISGDFGPKAKDLLHKFDVQMVIIQEDDLTVGDIIRRLKN